MQALPAHAKVNLALDVVGRRPDGFHDVVTVVAAIDWHDLACVDVRPGDGRTAITVRGPTAGERMDAPGQLLDRTAAALRRLAAPLLNEGASARLDVTIAVEKRVPVGAGLGGGSADAAAVLRAGAAELSAKLGINPPAEALWIAAAALGSDVPATLAGGVAVARGRGDRVERIRNPQRLHLAVALVGACETAAVYGALRDMERRDTSRAERVAAALSAGELPKVTDYGSALEAPARRLDPRFAAALDTLRSATGLPWPLTGSGGAVFQPTPDERSAADAAAAARGHGYAARVCRTLTLPAGAQDPPASLTTIAT